MPEFVYAIPIIIFVITYNAVRKKKEQEAKAKQASLNKKLTEMEAAREKTLPPTPAFNAGSYPPRPVLPTKKPPQIKKHPAKPVIVDIPVETNDMPYLSPEGTELHEDKAMHGSPVVPTQPAQKEQKPLYSTQELKKAFIMKEILDKPVSRRAAR